MDHEVVREARPWHCPVERCGTVVEAKTPAVRRAQIQHHIGQEIAAGHSAELEAAGQILLELRPDA